MKQLVITGLVVLALAGCVDDKPFVKHTLQTEKVGTCAAVDKNIGMTSNTNGDRYTFNLCLPADFRQDECTIKRSGDTLFVNFPTADATSAQFKLTLDVDAKPRYSFIKIGEQLLAVAAIHPY